MVSKGGLWVGRKVDRSGDLMEGQKAGRSEGRKVDRLGDLKVDWVVG